ncbi:helicase associated domain-containing protein [Arthrobacter sp. HMWF013]|uniref:helicase associated domain-containing protein n=1 Tax=Arthrobacter sp. HMWF013 TaxID=2056849 RepID=UPI000D345807|nr:helicase associated domain-containing protein [Arthrobacter sp. HMWF013]PTT70188.1 helicase-associated protein [Arthrobacter sp. HMWF013]
MTAPRRRAPDPELVQMYRQGVPAPKIAAAKGMAESTVRYHLHLAAQTEPGLRDEHQAALGKAIRNTAAGMRNLNDTIAFFEAEGRLPTTGGKSARERSLGSWLHARRQAAEAGTLSPLYREGLAAIPGWDTQSSRTEVNAARWDQRLAELSDYRAAGHDWPRHKGPATEQERVLGVWLHVQRISLREGKLTPDREGRLDGQLPGWREGRARSGGRRTASRPGD